ncbi:hypothetical protein BOX15_Mlig012996g2, partial [Macrostomum lignano]
AIATAPARMYSTGPAAGTLPVMQQQQPPRSSEGRQSRIPPTPAGRPLLLALLHLLGVLIVSFLQAGLKLARTWLGLRPAQVSGQIVLVTGAAQGIGLATAELFAKQKCVTVLTDVSAAVHDAAKSLESRGYLTASYQMDVTRPDSVSDCLADVVRRFGKLDILVSNAGVFQGRPLLDLTEAQIRATVDVNLMGTIWVVRAALPHMIKRGRGHIVSVASMAACMGVAYCTDYSASKFGSLGFMEAVQDELRRMGLYGRNRIFLSAVCPTFLDPGSGGVLVGKSVKPGMSPELQLTPAQVAASILSAVQYRHTLVCVPASLQRSFMLRGLLPLRACRAIQDFEGAYFDER